MNLKIKMFLLGLVVLKISNMNAASGGFDRIKKMEQQRSAYDSDDRKIKAVSVESTKSLSDKEKLNLYKNLIKLQMNYFWPSCGGSFSHPDGFDATFALRGDGAADNISRYFKKAEGDFDTFIQEIEKFFMTGKVNNIKVDGGIDISDKSKAEIKSLLQKGIATRFLD